MLGGQGLEYGVGGGGYISLQIWVNLKMSISVPLGLSSSFSSTCILKV